MVKYSIKGDFNKTNKFFQRALKFAKLSDLDKFGREGVEALRMSTPKDTGETANSWSYEIEHKEGRTAIYWKNSHIVNYVNIAIILQYGHATKNGSWVEGRDYINPALQPVFDRLAEDAWREITR